jgi:hypothetical protein
MAVLTIGLVAGLVAGTHHRTTTDALTATKTPTVDAETMNGADLLSGALQADVLAAADLRAKAKAAELANLAAARKRAALAKAADAAAAARRAAAAQRASRSTRRVAPSAPLPPTPVDCKSYHGNQQVGCSLLANYGFALSQMRCLVPLWSNESGWSTTSGNPSSGAYGIPQALPGNKMAAYGADWKTNPVTQIKWGLSYIRGRYGNPCAAYAHWQSNGWY